MEFNCTTGEFAELVGVEYAIAHGVLKYLQAKGLVKVFGKRPASGGKGKPSTIWLVPNEVHLVFKKQAAVA